MITKRVEFENNRNEKLAGILRIPDSRGDEKEKFPAIIFCHTFHDTKDHEFIISMWDSLSRQGFICLRFDLSGHGESQGDYRNMTITQDVKDLKAAFEFVRNLEQVDKKRIGMIGHSTGGIDAILLSADHKEIKSIAVISTRADIKAFIESYMDKYRQEEWRRIGRAEFYGFDEVSSDFLMDAERYEMFEEIKKVKCPIMIVHGTEDARVPFEDARELFNHANEPKRLELIEGADHRFSEPAHRQELLDTLGEWFSATLR
ncbi:MAG: alpha/beta fold hydrolase [Candidatus Woesearchaeota archaeon]|nr:alpha/beta fold hydrolase [Candidatus Woesearchaeota archaeon]